MNYYKVSHIHSDHIVFISYEAAAIAAINFVFKTLEQKRDLEFYTQLFYSQLHDFIHYVNNNQYREAMNIISYIAEDDIYITKYTTYESELYKLDDRIIKLVNRKIKEQVFK